MKNPFISGFSLLEVLISLFLVAMMMLDFEATALFSMRDMRAQSYYQMATMQLQNITERLYALQEDDTAEQIALWNEENKQLLPQGRGWINGSFPNYQIYIQWGEWNNPCQSKTIGRSGCLIQALSL